MKKSGFTLIELMVVIMIVGVLFAVALPMFENAGKKDTRQAAQTLVNTLRLARQHAISARQWTLVVFANAYAKYSSYAKDPNNLDKCLRSYAVLAVTNNMDGRDNWGQGGRGSGEWRDPSPDLMKFEFLTDWKRLPDGIYFDDDKELKANWLFGKENFYTGKFKYSWDPANPNDRVAPMSAVLFKPNGRAFVLKENADQTSDAKKRGRFWTDNDGLRIYVTSAKFYQPEGDSLDEGEEVPGGTCTIIRIRNKTGQMEVFDQGQLNED